MPHPYPGQEWKHGWVPLSPGARREKNHGRPVKDGPSTAAKPAKTSENSSAHQDRRGGKRGGTEPAKATGSRAEMYTAYTDAGFNEHQALYLVGQILAASVRGPAS